ncbi:zearalenone lactonase [Xylaria palmicola]|nr:zearalenone lactonase [Xylaria palmicola]
MATQTGSLQLAPSRGALSYAITAPSSPGGQQPVVLLSSALCAPLAVWDHVVPHLTGLGFRVLRYDAPGHGASGVPADLASTTFDAVARDVHALLAHLGIQRLHAWVGVSFGAATAVVFAARYPGVVERLVPCGTIACSPAHAGIPDAFGPRVAAARERGNLDTAVEETLERWFGRPWLDAHVDEAGRVRRAMRTTSVDGFEACCAALRSPSFDLRPLAATAGEGVDAALLLVGEKDGGLFTAMKELRTGIETGLRAQGSEAKPAKGAGVDLKVVKNGGHLLFVDGFDSFMGLISEFLTRA